MKKIFLIFSITLSNLSFGQNPAKSVESRTNYVTLQTYDSIAAFKKANADMKKAEAEFLILINQYRKHYGLNAVELDQTLCLAAKNQAEYMKKTKTVGHIQTTLGYETLGSRVEKFDLTYELYSRHIAENCLRTYFKHAFYRNRSVAQDILDLWVYSKAHDTAQRLPKFKKIGISFISDSEGFIYATTVYSE